jgi:hypothetical protein
MIMAGTPSRAVAEAARNGDSQVRGVAERAVARAQTF